MLPNEVPTVSVPPPEEEAEPADTSPLEPEQRTTAHFPAAEPSNDSRHADWPTVAGHEITAEIAKGGMGIVFAARDTTLNREVAIKTLLPELAERSHLAWQFDRESRITAQLPHPGVPPVHASGTLPDGRPFLVMKLIRGHTLDAELRVVDRVANLPRLLSIFEQICQTVGYAHSVGIIHRDLKPLNVMVGAFGEVQVMDWGLARELRNAEPGMRNEDTEQDSSAATQRGASDESDATWAGSAKGTPTFMPPEQARGEWDRVDARSDVFALGGILCVLLTGKPAYTGQDLRAIIQKARAGDLAEAFSRLDACRADADLISLCKRCLSENPADRPANGKALADAVAAYRAGVEERARNAETQRAAAETEAREQRKRRKVQLALATTTVMLFGLVAAGAWWNEKTQAEQAAAEAERTLKAENARERARNLLTLAAELRKDYRYAAAETTLNDAAALAEKFAPDLAVEVEQAKHDVAFVRDLDSIRMKRSTWIPDGEGKVRFDEATAPGEYRAAFLGRGLDVVIDPDAVAGRVKAAAVRTDLLTALDDWLILEPDAAIRDKVLAVLRQADADSGVAPFRDPTVWGDKAKLEALAAKSDTAAMSPGAIVAVAGLMRRKGVDATPLLRTAIFRHPRDFHIAFAFGEALFEARRDADALGAYRAARAIRADSPALLSNLGIILKDAKDFPGAIAAYKEAIRLDPKDAVAYTNLGLVLQISRDLPGATAAYRDAIGVNPNYARAHNNLGVALYDARDFRGAIAAYKEAFRHDPKYANAHFNLGNALRAVGDLPGAIAAYKEAIRLNPQDASSHTSLGVALKIVGDLRGAIAAYKEAIRLDPKSAMAHYNLGLSLRAARDLPGAIAAWKDAIRLNPNSADAHFNLGVGLRDSGDLPGAIAAWKEVVRLTPQAADAHAAIGFALRNSGDMAGSRVALAEAARLDPNRWEPAFRQLFPTPVAPPPREAMP